MCDRWVWIDGDALWLPQSRGTSDSGHASVAETHVEQTTIDAEEKRKAEQRGRLGFTGDPTRGRKPARTAEDR